MTDLRHALRNLARPVVRRLPAPVRRRLRGLLGRPGARSLVPHRPALTVVVAVGTDATGVEDCVASVLAQTLADLEVIVAVPDGAGPEDARDARQAVLLDPRVRSVSHPGHTAGAGWNAGAKVSTGSFLAFLSPAETVPASAYATLVRSLRRTGSDFASGAVTRRVIGRPREPERPDDTHDLDRPAARLSDQPTAVCDVTPGNRVFRASFWAGTGGFDESPGQQGVAIVAATLMTHTFDLFRAVTCVQHGRASLPATGVAAREAFAEQLRRLEAMNRQVTVRGGPAVRSAWLGGVLDGEFGDLLGTIQLADASTRAELSAAAARLVGTTEDDVWSRVRVDRKLRLWLAAAARWDELDLLVHHFRLYGETPATEVRGGRIYARRDRLPYVAEAGDHLLELSRSQTELAGRIQGVSWHDGQLVVLGWVFAGGLDLSAHPPQLSARWVDLVTAATLPCPIQQVERPAANRWSKLRYQDVSSGGFDLRIDRADLPDRGAKWVLEVTVQAGGVCRRGPIRELAAHGIGRGMPAGDVRHDADPFRVVPQLDPQLGFLLQVRQERVRAGGLRIERHRATGELCALDDRLDALVSVLASNTTGELTAELGAPDQDGRQAFALDLPGVSGGQDWEFRAVDARQRHHRVSWPLDPDQSGRVIADTGAGWVRSTRGFCRLVNEHSALEAVEVELIENRLAVVIRLVGVESAATVAQARLIGSLVELPVAGVEPVGDGRMRLVFELRASRWGGPVLPLPSGDYRVVVGELAVTCANELLATLPSEGLVTSHAFEVGRRGLANDLVIWLGKPRPWHETSLVARERTGEWYQQLEVGPSDAVLFQCYRGDFVTDSQLALHRELHRRGTSLELLWSIKDLSVPVPEGGRGLLIESREWYEALASSRYLCTNVDFERSFRRRPHQRYLQTFHGYPFKSMGAAMWRAQGRPEAVIAAERDRRGSAWDAIVVPAEFCVEFYRREYGFSGEALVTGYPRDDGLFAPDAGEVRARVRTRLDIDEGQTVVLYAPTWRDTTATSAWTAQLFDQLDLEALAAQLGPGYAVWLRGHNYNLRDGLADTSASVTDVSSYPEINDLILAADVAILDYSSLRFDWLLTGKPVIFFVPDLEDYLRTRTVLYDYGPTAPGPHLTTTADVGAALLDLETVTARYAAARRTFNERFNTLNDGRATERVVDAFFR